MQKSIKTEVEYVEAINEIRLLWGSLKDTPEGKRLDDLISQVEYYENEHYQIGNNRIDQTIFVLNAEESQQFCKEMERSKIDIDTALDRIDILKNMNNGKGPDHGSKKYKVLDCLFILIEQLENK